MANPIITGTYEREVLHPLATETIAGSAPAGGDYGQYNRLVVQLRITSVAGALPTLDLVIEDSVDGANWNVIGTFPQKIVAGVDVLRISTPFASQLRSRHTIGGTTPSFTFEVVIHANR